MIINVATKPTGESFVYYCNGVNDSTLLQTFIENLRKKGFNNFTVDIVGEYKSDAVLTVDNTGYLPITLNFSKCNRITVIGAFMNVKNVRIVGCSIYHQNNASDVDVATFTADESTFDNCMVTGGYWSGTCKAFSVSRSRLRECTVDITNNGGGYFANCRFLGLGAVKGQGFYIRGGQWATMINCVFRGYTKDTTNGWGGGLMGESNEATTVSLLGMNCNQMTVEGFSQTKSFELLNGYGVYSGTFFTAVNVGSNLTSLGSFNRNRT